MAGITNKLLNYQLKYGICYLRSGRLSIKNLSQAAPKLQTANSIAAPVLEGEERVFPEKIVNLVNQISGLTLVEVADLNDLLKKTLKLPDAPMMVASASSTSTVPQEEDAVAVKQEKTSFSVRIVKFDESRKVALIKEIKNLIPGLNLVQAKKFVETSPSVVRTDAAKDEAEKLKETLAAVGAIVEID